MELKIDIQMNFLFTLTKGNYMSNDNKLIKITTCQRVKQNCRAKKQPQIDCLGLNWFDESNCNISHTKKIDLMDCTDRPDVAPSEKEVEICQQYLEEIAIRSKTINFNHTSYGWKHEVERWYERKYDRGIHIYNGAFILAAWKFGLKIYARPRCRNAFFNLSEKCWRNHYEKIK